MQIRYKGLHYDLPEPITKRTSKKITALKKYLGRDADAASAYVELGKHTEAHQTGPIWQALINFTYQGTLYRAEALEETIEKAIDKATDELGKELRRAKKKQESLVRRSGSIFKSLGRHFG